MSVWRRKSVLRMQFFCKKPTRRARSSCPRCQHSSSKITSATKPPKRRNMPGICLTKPSQPAEYHHIPDWSAGTVPQDPLYSAEYSGTRSCQTPLIFQKIFRNILERLTSACVCARPCVSACVSTLLVCLDSRSECSAPVRLSVMCLPQPL